MPFLLNFSTTASVFIALRRDESLAPKGIIKGGDWGDGLDDRDAYSVSSSMKTFCSKRDFIAIITSPFSPAGPL
jgi:hypothetical protein